MIQNFCDHFSASSKKSLIEFEEIQQGIYNQSNVEFPNRKSGRITGQILPDAIDPKGKWEKHYLTTPERNNIKLLVVETDYLLADRVDFDIHISCSPTVSINEGKNNKAVSLISFNKLVDAIQKEYCINAEELILHSIERTFIAHANHEIVRAFNSGCNKLLIFKDKLLLPFFTDQNNVFMGYNCSKSHYGYKFYLVDAKFGEELFQFRMERHYTRISTFKKSHGAKTLNDLRSLEMAYKCAQKTLEDFDDVIISDSTIRTPSALSKKERMILKNSSDPEFWLKAKLNKDKNTFKDWVKTFRKLSDDYGNGFHTKMRNIILIQINEIQDEIENQNRKYSPDVTCICGVTCSEINTKKNAIAIKEMNKEMELINSNITLSKKQIHKEKREQRDVQFKLFIRALSLTLQQMEGKQERIN